MPKLMKGLSRLTVEKVVRRSKSDERRPSMEDVPVRRMTINRRGNGGAGERGDDYIYYRFAVPPHVADQIPNKDAYFKAEIVPDGVLFRLVTLDLTPVTWEQS